MVGRARLAQIEKDVGAQKGLIARQHRLRERLLPLESRQNQLLKLLHGLFRHGATRGQFHEAP